MRACLQNANVRFSIASRTARKVYSNHFFFNCSDKLVRGTNITVTLCILTTWLLHNQIIITKANLTPDHFLTSTKSPKIHSGDFVTSYTKTLCKHIII